MVETAHSDPLIGSMLGKNYRVLERIGMGGMAVVYLVEHQTLLKRFAAKVLLSAHASSSEARARFTQEAHSASQLDHENIVTITDFGTTPDQRPFFVMELLRGKTLADRLAEGPMSLEAVVAVSVPAARALAHAHAEDIVHRDIKPENIFLVERSQGRWSVKVLDFGIAKVPVNDRMTKTGQALGSPMYMAPEACRGDEVDVRADVYSFGILLYLMLAGRVPFQDDNILKILQMQVSSPIPPPTTYNPDLPLKLEAVIMRALEKNRDERFANMEELLIALEDALPEGSDALLLQAQFGASTTPFPGSLERVRNLMSASGNFRVSASGQHSIHTTGQHNAKTTGQQTPPGGVAQAVSTLPAAPRRSRAGSIALTSIVLLGGAGAFGYYQFMSGRDEPTAVANGTGNVTGSGEQAAGEAPIDAAAIVPEPTPPTPPANDVAVAPTAPATSDGPAATTPPPTETVDAAVPRPVATTKDDKRTPTKDAKRNNTKIVATKTQETKAATPATTTKTTPTTTTSPTSPTLPTTTAIKAAPPEVVVTTPPKEVTTPVPAPPKTTPLPAAQPQPAQVNIGSLDATPTIAKLDVEGSLPSSTVRRAVERVLPTLRDCYRTAAKAKQSTPALSLAVHFKIEEDASASKVTATGDPFGSLAGCVQGAVDRVQSPQAPDVGTVNVSVTFKFTPK